MPLELPPTNREHLLTVRMAEEPSPTARGLSETELILICCLGFALGYFFRWVSAATSPVDMGYVIALLDKDGNGQVDHDEIAYAASLIVEDKTKEIEQLPNKIKKQERKVLFWEVTFWVSVLLCVGSTCWAFAVLKKDPRVLFAFVPSLLLAMFCLVQLIRNKSIEKRLNRQKHDSKKFRDRVYAAEKREVALAMSGSTNYMPKGTLQEPLLC